MLFSESPQSGSTGGVIDGDMNTLPSHPDYEGIRQAMYLFGDRETGPVILLTDRDPGPEWLTPTHHHRTSTFRIYFAEMPKQSKMVGHNWMGFGDFVAMDSNVVYTEKLGSVRHWSLVLEADRRGSPSLVAHDDPAEWIQMFRSRMEASFGFSGPVFESDEEAEGRLVTTFAPTPTRRPSVFGSMQDQGWEKLADGSELAAVFLGALEDGPVVLLSRNTPGALEAPNGAYADDRCRLVLSGSCTIGGRSYGPGQLRFTEAGVAEGPVVHGPDGSTQVVILASRRAWVPTTEDPREIAQLSRLHEVERFLVGHRKRMLATN